MGRGDVVEYFHDDAMLATLALEMAAGGRFPLTGILSSTGIPNPPTSVYLMALPFSLSSDPHFAVYFIMLLNVLGVGLLWLLAHRYFGARIAWIAGLLYAINPWAVLFSRKIWAQDFHTPLILLGLLLLLYGFWEERRGWFSIAAQSLSLPLLLFAFQIHFAAWALFPLILIVLWFGRKQMSWQGMVLAVLLSILAVLPYLTGLSQTLDSDPERISDAVQRSAAADSVGLNGKAVTDAIMLAAGIGLETWLAPDQQAQLSAGYPPLVQASLILGVGMMVGIAASLKGSRRWTALLVAWAFLPTLMLLYDWTKVYIHYFIPSIPAMTLLTGMGLSWGLDWLAGRRLLKGLLWFALLLVCGLQILQWRAALDYVESHHVDYPGFTTPLGILNRLRDSLREAEDVLILSQGMSWNLHHEVAVWDTLLWDDVPCVRTLVGNGYAVFPSHAFSAVVAPDAPLHPANGLYAKEAPALFKTRNGGKDYVVHQWEAAPIWTGLPIQPVPPTLFDNGVQLSGYALAEDRVILEWRLPDANVGADYQFTAQLFDAAGHRISQWDATFWHGRHWCAGDRLLTWGPLEGDAAATLLKVGMYILGTGKDRGRYFNANVLDALGNPSGQSVDIRLD